MRNAPTPGGARDRPRLGELLVQAGYLTQAQLEAALREQSSWGGRLGQNLVDAGLINETALASAIARQLRLRVVDLDLAPPPEDVTRLVPVSIAERYGLVAISVARMTGRILVACVDPTNNDAMREVRSATGLIPEACVATASQIERVVRHHYYGDAGPIPTPDPNLHVTVSVAREPNPYEELARGLDSLLELVRKDGGEPH